MVDRYVTNALVYLGTSEEREPGGLVGEQATECRAWIGESGAHNNC